MGRVWVLDTDTKGTGAEMVPLDKVVKQPGAGRDKPLAQVKRKPQPPKPPEPRKPRRSGSST